MLIGLNFPRDALPNLIWLIGRMPFCELYSPMDEYRESPSTFCAYNWANIWTKSSQSDSRYCDEAQDNLLIDFKCMDTSLQQSHSLKT